MTRTLGIRIPICQHNSSMYNLINHEPMKKALLFSAAVAAMALVSCNRQDQPSVKVIDDGTPVQVTVTINAPRDLPSTRVTNVTYADESKVNTLQVFVFNDDEREAYRNVSQSMQALVPATSGERTVWAIVNAPDLSEVMSLSALRAAVTLLTDNAKDSFVMTGSVTQELVDGGNVPVTVKRIVSRVSVNRISTSLKDYRQDYSVKINKIYLINVAADNKYDVGGAPADWLNRLGSDPEADAKAKALLYEELGEEGAGVIVKNNVYTKEGEPVDEDHAYNESTHKLADGVTVATDNSHTKEYVFYPYPNIYPVSGTPDTYADEWNPRGTLLVLEVVMYDGAGDPIALPNGATTGYYPIILPALERNKTYVIEEIRITRLPGESPYKPIETGEAKVTIIVDEWEMGLNLGTVSI